MGTTMRGRLVDDLAGNRLVALTVVVPDQCHNTHDCPIGVGDRWLSRVVPRILAGPAYRAGRTAVVVTWDEGAGGTAGQDCRARQDASCRRSDTRPTRGPATCGRPSCCDGREALGGGISGLDSSTRWISRSRIAIRRCDKGPPARIGP
jgi:hypothetical protein